MEGSVRYVKHNALAGRSEELLTWEDYQRFAPQWRDVVANVRLHATTQERESRRESRVRPPFNTLQRKVLNGGLTPM